MTVLLSRWLVAAAGAAVLVAPAAVAVRYAWLPGYRPGLGLGERYGVDVSHHQGEIDWAAVAGDDIEFAYIKATEGGDFVDSRFAENWAAAGAAGIDRGAYHFFTLCRPGALQGRNFLDTVPVTGGDLDPALDLELGGNCSQRPPGGRGSSRGRRLRPAGRTETGRQVVLYELDSWTEPYPTSSAYDRPRWVRSIPLRPDGDWHIWQFNPRGRVDGVDSDIDVNVMATEHDQE